MKTKTITLELWQWCEILDALSDHVYIVERRFQFEDASEIAIANSALSKAFDDAPAVESVEPS